MGNDVHTAMWINLKNSAMWEKKMYSTILFMSIKNTRTKTMHVLQQITVIHMQIQSLPGGEERIWK